MQRRIASEGYGMVNHIISEFGKIIQKQYKNKHDWVGKVNQLGIVQEAEF